MSSNSIRFVNSSISKLLEIFQNERQKDTGHLIIMNYDEGTFRETRNIIPEDKEIDLRINYGRGNICQIKQMSNYTSLVYGLIAEDASLIRCDLNVNLVINDLYLDMSGQSDHEIYRTLIKVLPSLLNSVCSKIYLVEPDFTVKYDVNDGVVDILIHSKDRRIQYMSNNKKKIYNLIIWDIKRCAKRLVKKSVFDNCVLRPLFPDDLEIVTQN